VIFQESLMSGSVPEDWKKVNVTSLFKKGGRQKMGNYWPVILTSVMSKILESIIEDEIAEYLQYRVESEWLCQREVMSDKSVQII